MVRRNEKQGSGRSTAIEPAIPKDGVPEAVIDEVAGEIASLVRRAELRCAFEVGRIVVERFYDGDHAAWHRKGPKANSLARLAERLQARGVGGSSALHLCLGVFETLTQLGEDSTWNLLTRSHVRAVLALPAPERVSLLQEAQAGEWTVAQLEEAAAAQRTGARRGGRDRKPALVRVVETAERLFAPGGPAFRDLADAARLDPETVRDLHARLVLLRGRIEALQVRLSPKRLQAIGATGDSPRPARHERPRTGKRPSGAIRRDSVARSGASERAEPSEDARADR